MHPDHRLARLALESYPLAPTRLSILQQDRQLLFAVRTKNGKYALRIYKSHGDEPRALRSQCEWLRAILRDTELLVPEPIANIDGDHVTRVDADQQRYCTLTRWVPGRRRFRARGPGVRVLHRVGQIMAKLHSHGATFKASRSFRCPRWDFSGLFGRSSPWRPQRRLKLDDATRRMFHRITRRTQRAMDRLGTGPDVFGLIHGDLMQANYVIDGNDVHPIDFADFGRGYFLYDMAVTLLMLRPFDRDNSQRCAFIEGYRSCRPFPAAHEALLDNFIACRAVLLVRWILGAENQNPDDLRWVAQTLRGTATHA